MIFLPWMTTKDATSGKKGAFCGTVFVYCFFSILGTSGVEYATLFFKATNSFLVKIIPYTLAHTNLKYKKKGNMVNLEFDILAKYASKR